MTNNFSLNGVAEYFLLGKKGPRVKRDGDKIQFRNNADDAFINIQALDPVDPQDMVTLQYLQDNSANLPFNTDLTLHSVVTYNGGNTQQIGEIDLPENALVYQIQVEVTEAWTDASATLDIGEGTTNDRLMTQNQVCLDKVGLYVIETSDIFSTVETINGYFSHGTSTAGSAEVTVLYTISEEAAITPPNGAAPIIQGDTSSSLTSGVLTGSGENFGQTITMAQDGVPQDFKVQMRTIFGTLSVPVLLEVRIYDSVGGTLIGASDAIDVDGLNDGAYQTITFPFSATYNLTNGTQYYFEVERVSGAAGINAVVAVSSSDVYAGGSLIENEIATPEDLAFELNFVGYTPSFVYSNTFVNAFTLPDEEVTDQTSGGGTFTHDALGERYLSQATTPSPSDGAGFLVKLYNLTIDTSKDLVMEIDVNVNDLPDGSGATANIYMGLFGTGGPALSNTFNGLTLSVGPTEQTITLTIDAATLSSVTAPTYLAFTMENNNGSGGFAGTIIYWNEIRILPQV
jgi:hypothetical protein